MTSELEQEFFKVFGIEQIEHCKYFKYVNSKCDKIDTTEKCLDCIGTNKVYPEITDRKLLKLICINSYFCGVNFHHLWVKNPDEIKAIILDEIIRWYQQNKYGHEKCKHQIQQLFKEEE